jgi:STE24 endopeptidase
MHPFSIVFLAFVVLATLTDLWLAARQARYVRAHRGAVPAQFSATISLETHHKAADYTLAKLAVERWAGLWSVAVLLAWTLGGGLDALDRGVRVLGLGELATGVAVMLGVFVIGHLLDMPFDLWRTFGVEARFGFNKMRAGLYIGDQLKQLLLLALIGGPLAWVILWLMQGMGPLWWLYAWLVWTAFSLLMIWAFPSVIAPLFNTFTPLEEGEFRDRIEALLARCGFASKGLFVMDGSKRSAHGNAYFTGLGNAKRIVFFDTLIKSLDVDEAEAVLAHELGHFRHGHVKKRLLVMTAMSLAGFALLGWLAQQAWFYRGLGVSEASHHAALLLFMLAMPVFMFWVGPISSWFSRRHEFEADAYAARYASGDKLVSALVTMYEDNAATLTPDPLYSAWHDSHPPAPVRIAHLLSLKHARA